MKRRSVLLGSLASFAAIGGLPVARARAQGIAPIAIASATAGGRTVVRLYPGRGRNEFLAMVKIGGGTTYRKVSLRTGSRDAFAHLLNGEAQSIAFNRKTIPLKAALRGTSLSGEYSVPGAGSGTVTAQMDPVTGGVALAGIVAVVAIVAIIASTGDGGSASVDTPLGKIDVTIGKQEEAEPEGIIARPECDGPPIRLC